MALNTLVIYLSFCFVIVVPEEMTQRYEGGRGGEGKGIRVGCPKCRVQKRIVVFHDKEGDK
jgi:hypothetical protein